MISAVFVTTLLVSAYAFQPLYSQRRLTLMNAGMRTLDDDNYCEIMSSSKLVLVDNMAKWCGPCRLMEKIISKCEEKYGDDLVVAKFDVESGNSNVLIEFLKQDVMPRKLPQLTLFKDGQALKTRSGLLDQAELECFIEESLDELRAQNVHATKQQQTNPGLVNLATKTIDDYMLAGFH